jgi:hypothetical protein
MFGISSLGLISGSILETVKRHQDEAGPLTNLPTIPVRWFPRRGDVAEQSAKRYWDQPPPWRGTMNQPQTLADLIAARCHELGLDPRALGHRLGYSNPAKAVGRVQALCDGHVTSGKSQKALERLPEALGVERTVVDAAVATTVLILSTARKIVLEDQRRVMEAAEAGWRANFQPHGVILTSNRRPSNLAMCAMTGGIDRWLVVPLDRSQGVVTYPQQVLKHFGKRGRVEPDGRIIIPFFGMVTGFVVNYTPTSAVRFDQLGRPLERLDRAHRPDRVESTKRFVLADEDGRMVRS